MQCSAAAAAATSAAAAGGDGVDTVDEYDDELIIYGNVMSICSCVLFLLCQDRLYVFRHPNESWQTSNHLLIESDFISLVADFHHQVIGIVEIEEGTWMMLRQFGAFHFGLIGASPSISEAAVMDYVTSSFLSVFTSLHSLAVTAVRHSDLSRALHLSLPPVSK